MTNTQLAELFLLRLYDLAEAGDHTKYQTLNEIAAEFGVTDIMKILNVAKLLQGRGLIELRLEMNGIGRGTITGEGAVLVESGGQTGVIGEYRRHPENYRISIDQSTHFHGSISSSNVAVHASETNQGSTISPQAEALIRSMIENIRADTTLSERHRNEHLADLETLQAELQRQSPRRSITETVLAQLGDVASIGSLTTQLHQYLPQFFG